MTPTTDALSEWKARYRPIHDSDGALLLVDSLDVGPFAAMLRSHVEKNGEACVWTLHHGESETDAEEVAPGLRRVNVLGYYMTSVPAEPDAQPFTLPKPIRVCPDCGCSHLPRRGKKCQDCGCRHAVRSFLTMSEEDFIETFGGVRDA